MTECHVIKSTRESGVSKFKLLVFIGRFQPFHKGHEERLHQALEVADEVLILVGSSNRARSPRNPWTFFERSAMITEALRVDVKFKQRVFIEPLPDYLYNDVGWMTKVRNTVHRHCHDDSQIGLTGFMKDHSSYYLNIFGEWETYDIDNEHSLFNSTIIRERYFNELALPQDHMCSKPIIHAMQQFMATSEFRRLAKENNYCRLYESEWGKGPFLTTDAVVVQSGNILLVERGEYGKGLLAFPGGFINQGETLIECAIRELKEETRISDNKGPIPPGMLKSFITRSEIFDDPHRSERARIITHAYLFEPPNRRELFEVIGDDDAAAAGWYPISELRGENMFEDHYFIATKLLGLTL